MAECQMGGIGPMFGQLGFFAVRSSDKAPLAITRFTEEGQRLLTVLDRQLQQSPYLASENYTIADIAAYPWTLAATTFLAGARTHHRGDARSQALADGGRRARRSQARDGGAEGMRRKPIDGQDDLKRAGSRLSIKGVRSTRQECP